MKEIIAQSASISTYLLSFQIIELSSYMEYFSGFIFQTKRNASPIFLLAAPAYRSTIACTISAMLLTKSMTSISHAL